MIFHLTSEFVDPIIKKRLDNLAAIEVEKLYDSVENIGLQDKPTTVKSWRKRYLRSARLSVRKEQILKYLENPEEYVIPRKQ